MKKITKLQVFKLEEHGYKEALYGVALSYGLTGVRTISYDRLEHSAKWDRIKKLSVNLAKKGNGEDKFLRAIQVWVTIIAPRYFWEEFDTYKIATVAQSESSYRTPIKKGISASDFEYNEVNNETIEHLRMLVEDNDLVGFKRALPEGFMQERQVTLNYATIKNIIAQRKGHKLPIWKNFSEQILIQLDHPELLPTV